MKTDEPLKLRAGEIYAIRRRIKAAQHTMQTADELMIDRVLRRVARRFLKASATPGQCFACGCTDHNACDGGCSWANERRTLCDRCETA